jgi:histidinol-phosphate aminotransferase
MGSPRLRQALAGIPAYQAGKPPPPGTGPAYKLSSNENPHPAPEAVVAAAEAAVRSVNRYPDMGVAELHAALAERLDVGLECLASGAGSVAIVYQLLQAACAEGDEVVYAWRSFEAYPIAVGLTGARGVQVPVDDEGRHDLKAMADQITDATRVVLVCTPNNPTGPAVHGDELVNFVDAVPESVIIAIDEAYHEFIDDPAAINALEIARGRDNVVVLRTFSKAYGLAGLRVGYAVAPPELAQGIRKCALPFGVSSVAQAASLAALGCEDELMEQVRTIVAERHRVLDGLRSQGWRVPDAQGNFVWLALGGASAAFGEAAARAGVSVRAFAGDGVRVSIGEKPANDLFLEVADRWRQEHG